MCDTAPGDTARHEHHPAIRSTPRPARSPTTTPRATLTLVKTVTNDNGGTAVADRLDAGRGRADPITRRDRSTRGHQRRGQRGHLHARPSPADRPATPPATWSCTGGTVTGGIGRRRHGANVTCTINNNDQPATLTLVKTVTNDNGGTAVPDRLDARRRRTDRRSPAPPAPRRSPTPPVTAGTYTLSESGGPAGYTAGAWSCTAGTVTGGIARPAQRRQRHLHHQQQRPARHADPGQDRHQRQRRHRACRPTGPSTADRAHPDHRRHRLDRGHQRAGRAPAPTPSPSPADRPATPPAPGPAPAGTLTGASLVLAARRQTPPAPSTTTTSPPRSPWSRPSPTTTAAPPPPTDWTLTADRPDHRSPASPAIRGRHQRRRSTPAPTPSSETGGPAGYTAGDWSCTGRHPHRHQPRAARSASAPPAPSTTTTRPATSPWSRS